MTTTSLRPYRPDLAKVEGLVDARVTDWPALLRLRDLLKSYPDRQWTRLELEELGLGHALAVLARTKVPARAHVDLLARADW